MPLVVMRRLNPKPVSHGALDVSPAACPLNAPADIKQSLLTIIIKHDIFNGKEKVFAVLMLPKFGVIKPHRGGALAPTIE